MHTSPSLKWKKNETKKYNFNRHQSHCHFLLIEQCHQSLHSSILLQHRQEKVSPPKGSHRFPPIHAFECLPVQYWHQMMISLLCNVYIVTKMTACMVEATQDSEFFLFSHSCSWRPHILSSRSLSSFSQIIYTYIPRGGQSTAHLGPMCY